jgi:hypothetical protein
MSQTITTRLRFRPDTTVSHPDQTSNPIESTTDE